MQGYMAVVGLPRITDQPPTRFTDMSTTSSYTLTTFATGNAGIMREAARLADALADLPQCREPLPEVLQVPKGLARNDLIVGSLIGIAVLIVKDAFHDVYVTIIQPRLKPWLEKIHERLPGGRRSEKKAFGVGAWYEEYGVFVRVDLIGASFVEIVQQEHLIPDVHAKAIQWIEANGVQKPVHYYKIENGQFNAAPLLFNHVLELR